MSLEWNVFVFRRATIILKPELTMMEMHMVLLWFVPWSKCSSSCHSGFVSVCRERIRMILSLCVCDRIYPAPNGPYAALNDDFGLQIENNSRQIYGCNMLFYIMFIASLFSQSMPVLFFYVLHRFQAESRGFFLRIYHFDRI